MFSVASATVAPSSALFPIGAEDEPLGVFLEHRRPVPKETEAQVIDTVKVGKPDHRAAAVQDLDIGEQVWTGEQNLFEIGGAHHAGMQRDEPGPWILPTNFFVPALDPGQIIDGARPVDRLDMQEDRNPVGVRRGQDNVDQRMIEGHDNLGLSAAPGPSFVVVPEAEFAHTGTAARSEILPDLGDLRPGAFDPTLMEVTDKIRRTQGRHIGKSGGAAEQLVSLGFSIIIGGPHDDDPYDARFGGIGEMAREFFLVLLSRMAVGIDHLSRIGLPGGGLPGRATEKCQYRKGAYPKIKDADSFHALTRE